MIENKEKWMKTFKYLPFSLLQSTVWGLKVTESVGWRRGGVPDDVLLIVGVVVRRLSTETTTCSGSRDPGRGLKIWRIKNVVIQKHIHKKQHLLLITTFFVCTQCLAQGHFSSVIILWLQHNMHAVLQTQTVTECFKCSVIFQLKSVKVGCSFVNMDYVHTFMDCLDL